MIVDTSRWQSYGQGRMAPQGSISDAQLAARLFAYKRNVASGYRSVSPLEIERTVPAGRHILSPKVDGECFFLHGESGTCHLLSASGRVIAGVPVTEQAADLLGDEKVLLAGELYAANGSGRPRVYDLMSALGSGQTARPETLRFAAFDLLQDGDACAQAWPFHRRVDRLRDLFHRDGLVHAVRFEGVESGNAAAIAFERIVHEDGHEGMVLQLDTGDTLKVKPELTVDAAVVGYAEVDGCVHELLLALVQPDGKYLLIGRVSVGMSQAERVSLSRELAMSVCPSQYRKATDHGTLYRWVRPCRVVEVKCNDLMAVDSHERAVQRMLLECATDGWHPIGPSPSVSMINAVFLRVRNDKSVGPGTTGLQQVIDHVHLQPIHRSKLKPSTVLRREVYAKKTDTKTLVRKFVTWKTNKEDTDPSYPGYVAFFTDYSPGRKEPLKRELRVASTEERIDAVADLWLAENIKRGWECVSRDIVEPSTPAECFAGREAIPDTQTSSVREGLSRTHDTARSLCLSFARSASASFSIALKRMKSLAEHGVLSIEKDDHDREVWFSLTLAGPVLVECSLRISNLARMIRGWKSAEFAIHEESVRAIDFEGFLHRLEEVDRCRRAKARKGAKPCATACSLGCDQLWLHPSHSFLNAYQSRQAWWTVGEFDGRVVTVHKEGLHRQVAGSKNEPFRMCPRYDAKTVQRKIDGLPDTISHNEDTWRLISKQEDGSPAWIWPRDKNLPFGLVDQEREKKRSQRMRKQDGPTAPSRQRNVPTVSYSDVCGQDEAVEAVRDMIELPILHADLFRKVGVDHAGKGIILAGPPGTGKTLLARAVAGESQAHTEIIAGPELLSKWFGESERQLRTIFQRARELEPSVILFDEIDGIAGTRNGDSLQRTFVAQLLTLLDGMEGRGNVFTIATTNRPEDIDPALRRPGRFDRVIHMGLPRMAGRQALFAHHTKKMKLAADVDVSKLASRTRGLSGAQIAYICRRAGVLCIKEGIQNGSAHHDVRVTMQHLLNVIGEGSS